MEFLASDGDLAVSALAGDRESVANPCLVEAPVVQPPHGPMEGHDPVEIGREHGRSAEAGRR